MKLSYLFFGDQPDIKWELARQMGVKYAIAKLAPELTGGNAPDNINFLQQAKKRFSESGFELYGFEGDQFDMNKIKFGLPGRDEVLERYCKMLYNMGELGVGLLCYNFMAGIGWFRTQTAVPERGGALVSSFDISAVKVSEETYPQITEEQLWDNYRYFIKAVMPAAEKARVTMALHPDDPPVSPLAGIPRIFINAENIRKALAVYDTKGHALTFCQGTYTTMGEDVEKLIREFGEKRKIAFVHIRDVIGNRNNFRETFHDNGPTDMPAMLKIYQEVGFDGPLRSDHVPSMAGEDNKQHGYGVNGNLFGIGYIKGMMDALGITSV